MTIRKSFIAVLAVVLLAVTDVSPALAVPPLPSGFYGTVTVNGANAPAEAGVSARIDGTQYAHTTVQFYRGQMVYSLDVPGDDPATRGVVEGGVQGDTVVFLIDGVLADETATWQSGTNIVLDLSAVSGHKSYLPLMSRP